MSSGELRLGDTDIVGTIKEVLQARSQGMLLWASLLIKWICDLASDEEILQALPNSPTSLFEIYGRLLSRHYTTHKQYQKTTLGLVLVAYRPLSTGELRETLSVEPGKLEWNSAKLPNDITSLLICCGGLVIVDEEELSVRFVHESARQYLLLDDGKSDHSSFTINAAEKNMAQMLTTYLNFAVFDTQVSSTVLPALPGSKVIDSALSAVSDSSSRFLKTLPWLARSPRSETPDISAALARVAMQARQRKTLDLFLEKYARRYWFFHSACCLDSDPTVQTLVKRLTQRQLPVTTAEIPAPLAWTISKGYLAAFELLTDGGPDSTGETLQNALRDAAAAGHQNMVEKYMQAPHLFHVTDERQLRCDLVIQAANNHWTEVLRMLLNHDSMQEYVWDAVMESQIHITTKYAREPYGRISTCDLFLRAASKEWSTVLKAWSTDQIVAKHNINRHRDVTTACLNLILPADCLSKSNICRLDTPSILRHGIDKTLIQHCIPFEVQYACLNWPRHLKQSNAEFSSIESRIVDVLQHRLLTWFEAVSLLGQASEMFAMVSLVDKMFIQSGTSKLRLILRLASRFIQKNHFVADVLPLQIYFSGLTFAPIIFEDNMDIEMSTWLVGAPGMPFGWNNPSQILNGPEIWGVTKSSLQHNSRMHGPLMSMVFSPNGKQIASCAAYGHVQIWDTTKGHLRHKFRVHSDNTKLAVFSPDGKQLLCGKTDGYITIWDIRTSSLQHIVRASSRQVTSAIFSPDGKQLAFCSYGSSAIEIWDVLTGTLHRISKEHSDQIIAAAFSLDGKQLASSSKDGVVDLWNVTSGECTQSIKTGTPVQHITFHSHLPIIETDQGNFRQDDLVPTSASTMQRARFSLKDEWISLDNQKLVWYQRNTGIIGTPRHTLLRALNTQRSQLNLEPFFYSSLHE